MLFAKNKITSVEKLTLELSGMRALVEYEIVSGGDTAEVAKYAVMFDKGEKKRKLEKSVVCKTEKVLELVNSVKLLSWDGFYGSHPRGVRDGTMFALNASVNGGKTVSARGSQNFPRRYWKFTDGLYEILNA